MQRASKHVVFNNKCPYPFTAIVGKDAVKKAIMMNVINPKVGGVLIVGEKGTAKSTLVRSFGQILPEIEIINLPLNISEDRLIGSLDLKYAVEKGEKRLETGLLHQAHGNILYVDEVNLLSRGIGNMILDVWSSGVNTIEREGMSYSHRANFTLIGTMNPEEGMLSTSFLDRFGLYVEVKGERDVINRLEIMKRRMEYESNPESFYDKYKDSSLDLREKIIRAKEIIKEVKVSKEILKASVELCKASRSIGHRGDIYLVEAAKAIASLEDRKEVEFSHLKEAAKFVLPHRIMEPREKPQEESEEKRNNNESNNENNNQNPQENQSREIDNNESKHIEEENKLDIDSDYQSTHENKDLENKSKTIMEDISDIGSIFNVKDIDIQINDTIIRKGSGRRSKTLTGMTQGRYIKAVIPKGKPKDIAIDATLRTSALYQKQRGRKDKLIIKESDFRKKVREKRTGNTLLFVVDGSGSMGAKKRMKAVKGAIVSLLMDAYQKRDKVGMITFRGDSAEEMLQVTRSVDFAKDKLKDLPTGGRTPLSAGLIKGYQILRSTMLKDKDTIPVLVLITDGKANNALGLDDPVEEAISICQDISQKGIKALVIDTESGFIQMGLAKEVAKALDAQYYKLEELKDENIERVVRNIL
ncbi:MAG: VWA domain-containing protein [Firmicutes bacterium]|nr:VWA domain-containing protein [Bacillota bacterium]